MNTILLQPTDVLFFRDGRPMSGALAGHGAAWPLPNVVNAAFHAALHQARLDGDGSHQLHHHRHDGLNERRDRKFGSLTTAGPFPVARREDWFFPRPVDLQDGTLRPSLLPAAASDSARSSLPGPIKYAVANRRPPSKEAGAKPWLAREAYQHYLAGAISTLKDGEAVRDDEFSDHEHAIGIGIDPATDTTGQGDAEGKIYSAHYLRLREGWQLGVCAIAEDKHYRHPKHGGDLVKALLDGGARRIIIGGQQRVCTAAMLPPSAPPLPVGRMGDFPERDGNFLIKWILLSPAVWPAMLSNPAHNITPHPGGWLPNWVDPKTGRVLLTSGPGANKAKRKQQTQGAEISARLVAALVPKPTVVTGWALEHQAAGEPGGAQNVHLAVSAGAVYYFEARSAEDARKLAAALNWHGAEGNPAAIKNRRSTLLGEKGFGLGVCGGWEFFERPGTSATA